MIYVLVIFITPITLKSETERIPFTPAPSLNPECIIKLGILSRFDLEKHLMLSEEAARDKRVSERVRASYLKLSEADKSKIRLMPEGERQKIIDLMAKAHWMLLFKKALEIGSADAALDIHFKGKEKKIVDLLKGRVFAQDNRVQSLMVHLLNQNPGWMHFRQMKDRDDYILSVREMAINAVENLIDELAQLPIFIREAILLVSGGREGDLGISRSQLP